MTCRLSRCFHCAFLPCLATTAIHCACHATHATPRLVVHVFHCSVRGGQVQGHLRRVQPLQERRLLLGGRCSSQILWSRPHNLSRGGNQRHAVRWVCEPGSSPPIRVHCTVALPRRSLLFGTGSESAYTFSRGSAKFHFACIVAVHLSLATYEQLQIPAASQHVCY